MMTHPAAPAEHWKGPEGTAYAHRQTLTTAARAIWLDRALRQAKGIKRVIEFGANTGENLDALRMLSMGLHLTGVEINAEACDKMGAAADVVYRGSMTEWIDGTNWGDGWDLAMTRGVLIHIPPADLEDAYAALYYSSKRYVLVAEYYNPKPVEIEYRGRMGLLWKRDFAGEMMDAYPDLKLLDYGFVYHRDRQVPQDDVTWFLMEKQK